MSVKLLLHCFFSYLCIMTAMIMMFEFDVVTIQTLVHTYLSLSNKCPLNIIKDDVARRCRL